MKIATSETVITGKWIATPSGQVTADDVCERINKLVQNHLRILGHDPSGWDALYRDPDDKRLWELLYPQGHLHGGGPPELRYLDQDQARQKYGAIADY